MDRTQYLRMRQTKQMDMQVFYQYYVRNIVSGPTLDYSSFSQMFSFYIQAHSKQVFAYLDTKFNITVVSDKNGNELKFS
jgi:hypothetical protein